MRVRFGISNVQSEYKLKKNSAKSTSSNDLAVLVLLLYVPLVGLMYSHARQQLLEVIQVSVVVFLIMCVTFVERW